MELALIAVCCFFCLIWWLMYGRFVMTIFSLTDIGDIDINEPGHWPRLSLIIPACNEADTIEPAILSMLEQDYTDMEIILVNDRSDDNTGEIIDSLANDSRIKALHIDTLPENWLGKVHAQSVALPHATGDWILFTDADIHFEQGALKKAVSYVMHKQADHLALMPNVVTRSYWLEVIIRTFGLLFLINTKVHELEREDTQAVIGVGAFNLVKKSVLDKSDGIEWLRMEVADDVGMGLLVKRAEGRSVFAMAKSLLSVEWYPSIRSMFIGLEKNLFGAGAHYQITRLLILVFSMWLMVFSPFILIAKDYHQWVSLFAWLTLLWLPVLMIVGKMTSGAKLSMGLLTPVGQLVISLMMLHSGIMCLRRDGIVWRGTLYSLDNLKAFQRIKF